VEEVNLLMDDTISIRKMVFGIWHYPACHRYVSG
jgi:hypothetical protein